ncbi:hypothetical protein DFH08DRAFT_17737 [Mycena albidolilacea]|uniref:Uncharacterized protein n=1 Tax=Mycena albidolilacea TaxID=1033008 RepID=A0AAD7AUF4_9AGAR|nr:hypothetical protein DFH08DRAFT_17737 [Mycena albidolilacea]
MSPSLFRSWRKKDRPLTCPAQGSAPAVDVSLPSRSSNSSPVSDRMDSRRRPSDTPSDNSARFLWRFNKASYAETDTSSVVSVDGAHQTEAGPTSPSPSFQHPSERPPLSSPLSSPRSLDRPLPPLPPVRPPRPPSLNLNAIPSTSMLPSKTRQPRRAPQRRPAMPELHSDPLPRKLPVLDNVWEGFIREIEGRAEDILDFTIYGLGKDRPYTSQRGIEAVLDPPRAPQPRQTIYRTSASGSTPHFKSPHELHSDSESEDESQENVGFSLSQFPAPPPMSRRRAPPKPLVLLPTPSIAPLPPSPSFSSGESTPVATPTTPRYVEPSPRKGILKNSSTSLSSFAEPASPTTPTSSSPRIKTLPKATSPTPRPRLRSAQSVPYLQPPALANAHRTTSSDEPSTTHRRRVTSRPDAYAAQQFYSRAPLPPPPSNVQWGYAV